MKKGLTITIILMTIILLTSCRNAEIKTQMLQDAYGQNFAPICTDTPIPSPTNTQTPTPTPTATPKPTPTIIPTPFISNPYERLKSEIDMLETEYKEMSRGINGIVGNIISKKPFILEGTGVGVETLFNGNNVRYVILNPEDGDIRFNMYYGTHKFISEYTQYENKREITYMVFDKIPDEWETMSKTIKTKKKQLEGLKQYDTSTKVLLYDNEILGCFFDCPVYLGNPKYMIGRDGWYKAEFISNDIVFSMELTPPLNYNKELESFNTNYNDTMEPYNIFKRNQGINKALISKDDNSTTIKLLLRGVERITYIKWTHQSNDKGKIEKIERDMYNILSSLSFSF